MRCQYEYLSLRLRTRVSDRQPRTWHRPGALDFDRLPALRTHPDSKKGDRAWIANLGKNPQKIEQGEKGRTEREGTRLA